MALITPSNIRYILGVSFLSRLIIFLIQLLANFIIKDHTADAYRNKYHIALTTSNTSLILPDTYWYVYKSIEGYTKWDAQYFLEISVDGYTSEQHLAFLPLFPVAISLARQIVFEHRRFNFEYLIPTTSPRYEDNVISTEQLVRYIQSTVLGFALNNFIFFPLAALSLFGITKLAGRRDEKYAKNVILWFCFNPASIFFSACYTESLFAALTFTAMFLIEYKAYTYLTSSCPEEPSEVQEWSKENFAPISHLNRLLKIYFPSLALLSLSTATRSNGLVTIGFLIYQFLLKYAPLGRTNRTGWTLLLYTSLILECLQDVLVLLMSSVIAASGYITFQIYSYSRFCLDNYSKKGTLILRPEWCDNLLPHPYRQVQAKYWNVGLFQYYEFKQLPNFLLAFPISYLILVGSLKKSKELSSTKESSKHLVYYVQGIILTIFCGISINVQVTTRLLASSCPVIYWICADSVQGMRFKNKYIASYFVIYFVLGTILHVNFFPWT